MDLSTDLPLLVASAAAALLGTLLLFGGKSSGRTILLTRRSHVKYAKKKVPQAAVDRGLAPSADVSTGGGRETRAYEKTGYRRRASCYI